MPKEADHFFEASELRFPPGHWPESFLNGNKKFSILAIYHQDGEVKYAHYVCIEAGELAIVFND